MAYLDFKGKPFVYSHHLSVPFCPLKIEGEKSSPLKGKKPCLEDNLIIHGDNLTALKSLLPQYAGKIKLIYIDPPYNTGNEGWVYNDNVNSPLIKNWLKKVVDKEDLERHDKWLCMMWPRLQLLKELLSEDGSIFISMDDSEISTLKLILNEVFGEENFISQLIWKSGGTSASYFTNEHEYILCYSKNKEKMPLFSFKGLDTVIDRAIKRPSVKNPVSRIKFHAGIDFECEDKRFPNKFGGSEPVKVVQGVFEVKSGKLRNDVVLEAAWTMKDMIERWLSDKKSVTDQKGQKVIRFFFKSNGILQYEKEKKTVHPRTIIEGISTKNGSSELINLMGESIFAFPKSSRLIKSFIEYVTCPQEKHLILDSFAGSGTTAHAVLAANKEDGGNRKFILIECEDYADKITAERVRRVIKGVPSSKNEDLKKGLGGSFTYCTLGKPIELETLLKGKHLPTFEDLAKYVFFNATGKTLQKVAKNNPEYFIGETDNYCIHLLYVPDIKFLRSNASALNEHLAEKIHKKNQGNKKNLIFAANKFLSLRELKSYQIEYSQLPFALYKILG